MTRSGLYQRGDVAHSVQSLLISPLDIMLTIDNLTFSYGKKRILQNLSLKVERGEFAAILGPSGCGKTTLFRLIVGLQKPDIGRIQLQNQPAYLSQENTLLPWRTVLSNILLPTQLGKNSPQKEQALQLIKEVGLEGSEDAYPSELSGGMKQRALLARALIQKRSFLLLDEPFSSLDYFAKEEFYVLLKEMQKKSNLTILLITHDLHEAKALADTTYLLKEYALC